MIEEFVNGLAVGVAPDTQVDVTESIDDLYSTVGARFLSWDGASWEVVMSPELLADAITGAYGIGRYYGKHFEREVERLRQT